MKSKLIYGLMSILLSQGSFALAETKEDRLLRMMASADRPATLEDLQNTDRCYELNGDRIFKMKAKYSEEVIDGGPLFDDETITIIHFTGHSGSAVHLFRSDRHYFLTERGSLVLKQKEEGWGSAQLRFGYQGQDILFFKLEDEVPYIDDFGDRQYFSEYTNGYCTL